MVGVRRAGSRAPLAYMSAVVIGAVLFFLCFAAAFNGSWTLLVSFMLCYGLAGAVGVRAGNAAPGPLAVALVAAAFPWMTWLFPASVAEAGLPRALLWPAIVAVMGGLAWLGGALGRRRPRSVRTAGQRR